MCSGKNGLLLNLKGHSADFPLKDQFTHHVEHHSVKTAV